MPGTSTIKIKENGFADNVFSLLISFIDNNGIEEVVSIDYSDTDFVKTDKLLEWHFEDYISTPYDDSLLKRSLTAIEDYGKALFSQLITGDILYQYKKAYETTGPDLISIEIIGDSPGFHAIYWESLWDTKQPAPLATQGVSFCRRNIRPSVIKAITKPSAMLNLLIVTARPNEDEDVNYRTIQRPLIDMIARTETPVNAHILRPGTYEALIRHLDSKSGYYHIIHFDMHGGLMGQDTYNLYQQALDDYTALTGDNLSGYGLARLDKASFEGGERTFLFFESKQKGLAVPVEGEQLATMLENHKIPICILNACQSAKQANIEHETSLGRILNKKGLQAVIAMRYSVSVSAAEMIMKTLYTQLYNRESIDKAIVDCRKELYRSKKRSANYNYEIELEDWLLPVVYKNSTPVLKTIPLTIEEERYLYQKSKKQQQLDAELQYGFFGRDLEILMIEKIILLRSNILLLQGMGGAGKTTLLKYLAGWWLKTGFIEKDFYFGYDLKAYDLNEILRTIAVELYDKNEYHQFILLDKDLQVNRIVTKFRTNRYLLVLDNTESITADTLAIPNTLTDTEQQELKSFLALLKGGKSCVIIGSRSNEAWLKARTFENNTYLLGGLDEEAAGNFAQRIMQDNNVNIEYVANDADFGQLMELLAGYPLALKAILPNLAKKSSSEILEDLMKGLADLDADNVQSRTESIMKCIEYAHSNLSEETQEVLLCLAPFQAFADMRTEVISDYFTQLKKTIGLAVPTAATLNEVINVAERSGLMKRLSGKNLLTFQPLFTYFLRNKLALKDAAFQEKLQRAFVAHYQNMTLDLYHKIIDPNPDVFLNAWAFMKNQYGNFYNALILLLKWGQPNILIFSILEEYLDRTGQDQKRLELAEMVSKTMNNREFSKMDIYQLTDSLNLLNRLCVIYSDLKQFEKAYKLHPFLYEIIEKDYSSGKISEGLKGIVYLDIGCSYMENQLEVRALDVFYKALKCFDADDDLILIANTKRNIAVILSRQEKWAESKASFEVALKLYEQKNEINSMGVVFQNLAIIANVEDDFGLFISYSEKAINIFKLTGSKQQEGEVYSNMGIVSSEKKQLKDSFKYTKAALALYIESNATHLQCITYLNLSNICLIDKDFLEAKEYLKKATVIVKTYPEDRSLLAKMMQGIKEYVADTGDKPFGVQILDDIFNGLSEDVLKSFNL